MIVMPRRFLPLFGLLLLAPRAGAEEVKYAFDLSGEEPVAGVLILASYGPGDREGGKSYFGHAWAGVVSYPGTTPKIDTHYGWYPAKEGFDISCLKDCPGYLADEVEKQLESKPGATFRSSQTLTLLLAAAELKAAAAEVDRWKAGDKLKADGTDRFSLISRNCVTFSRSVLNATLKGRGIEVPAKVAETSDDDVTLPPAFVKNAAAYLRKNAPGTDRNFD